MSGLKFHITGTSSDSNARNGELITSHGSVSTPVFSPVGSQATVKTLTPDELKDIGAEMILANAYHLYLRPGLDVIKKAGGLHRFMGWERAILTDSGGFQIFSLARLRSVTDEGVRFQSHIDGSQHLITPELAIQIQETLGADIIMALDEVPSHNDKPSKINNSMDTTHKWAERCLKAKTRSDQALFAIVQGGLLSELRHQSAAYLTSMNFAGYAIGGLSLGEPKSQTQAIVEETAGLLPKNKPRYLMGVGSPEDIVEYVDKGIDIFDCVLPTRVARNGALFTVHGRRNIRNAVYREMHNPFETECNCYTCRNFTASYLHHLFRCEELLAYRLATIHNLYFMNQLMCVIRESIINGSFMSFKNSFIKDYHPTDERIRINQKQKWLMTKNNPGET